MSEPMKFFAVCSLRAEDGKLIYAEQSENHVINNHGFGRVEVVTSYAEGFAGCDTPGSIAKAYREKFPGAVVSSVIELPPSAFELDFARAFRQVQKGIHETAKEKGWWDEDRSNGEVIALIHSELSEALESLRTGDGPDDKIPEFTGSEAELADVIIRIMDFAEQREFRVAEALLAKSEFNKTRPRKHGKKF